MSMETMTKKFNVCETQVYKEERWNKETNDNVKAQLLSLEKEGINEIVSERYVSAIWRKTEFHEQSITPSKSKIRGK
jgi:hypothetical protein